MSDRVKPKPDVLVGLAPPVTAALEAVSGQSAEQQQTLVLPPSQIPMQPVSSLLTSATPPSQPVPAAMAVTPPIPSMANVVAPPSHPAATSAAACPISSTLPEINVKQEAEPMDTSKPGTLTVHAWQAFVYFNILKSAFLSPVFLSFSFVLFPFFSFC